MAETVEFHHLLGQFQALFGGIGFEHGQHGREFFAGERLVGAHFAAFGHEDIGFLGHAEAGLFGNPSGRFAHHGGIQFSAAAAFAAGFHAEDEFFEQRFFFFVDEIHAVRFEFVY